MTVEVDIPPLLKHLFAKLDGALNVFLKPHPVLKPYQCCGPTEVQQRDGQAARELR